MLRGTAARIERGERRLPNLTAYGIDISCDYTTLSSLVSDGILRIGPGSVASRTGGSPALGSNITNRAGPARLRAGACAWDQPSPRQVAPSVFALPHQLPYPRPTSHPTGFGTTGCAMLTVRMDIITGNIGWIEVICGPM